MTNQKWADLIKREILMYSNRLGRTVKDVEFAEWLKVDPAIISHWKRGNRVPTEETLDRIAALIGTDAYEAAGKPPRMPNDPKVRLIAKVFHLLPEEAQKAFTDMIVEAAQKTQRGEGVDYSQFSFLQQLAAATQ
jgi:transcriptional regulator with XRE-family HTH domain